MFIKEVIELEDTFLESKRGESPQAWLLIWRVRQFRAKIKGKVRCWSRRTRDVQTLTGMSRADVRRQVVAYAKRCSVVLIDERQRGE